MFLSEIILCTFNSGAFIEDCLYSVLPQLSHDIRLYIIDDASTDNTFAIIHDLTNPYSNLVTSFRNKKNLGLTFNLNSYLSLNRASYTFRMDSDDVAFSRRFSTQLNFALSNPDIDIIGSLAVKISQRGDYLGVSYKPLLEPDIYSCVYRNPFIHSSVLFKTSSILAVGNYNTLLRYGQDYDLWFRCVLSKLKVVNLAIPLLFLRVSSRHKYSSLVYWREFVIGIKGSYSCRLPLYSFLLIFSRLAYGVAANSCQKLGSLILSFAVTFRKVALLGRHSGGLG